MLENDARSMVDGGLARASARWPELRLEPTRFFSFVMDRAAAEPDAIAFLGRAHLEDLALAYACAQGQASAISHFERDFLSEVATYLARRNPREGLAEEVRQHLRIKLLMPRRDALPGIAAYTGRGPLGAWLRIASIRAARDLSRAPPAERARAPLETMRAEARSPEGDYVTRHVSHEFRGALESALAGLPPRERSLLRLYFLDGLNSDAIAAMYRVDGSTVRRWLREVRRDLRRRTHELLVRRLAIRDSEVSSLMRDVDSQIDVSLARCLSETQERSGKE